jgi:tRNA-specific 2-thiouridylase
MKLQCKAVKHHSEDGKYIGEHEGAHYFTIGQRKGLNIGGKKEPLFVLETNTDDNIVYVGQGENHPGLNRKGLFIPSADIHWIRTDLSMQIGESREYMSRIRYRQPLTKVQLNMRSEGLYLIFEELQRGITPGQFAAWYEGDELIGSGVIS